MDRAERRSHYENELLRLEQLRITADKRRQTGGAVAAISAVMVLVSLANPALAAVFFIGTVGGLVVHQSAKTDIDNAYRKTELIEKALVSLGTD